LLLAAAARGIGSDGACCCKSLHRVDPFPKALVWVRRVAPWLTWPAGSGRGRSRCTVCRSDARWAHHVVPSLAAARHQPWGAGAACASSLLAGAA